jgi:hypothetical protein
MSADHGSQRGSVISNPDIAVGEVDKARVEHNESRHPDGAGADRGERHEHPEQEPGEGRKCRGPPRLPFAYSRLTGVYGRGYSGNPHPTGCAALHCTISWMTGLHVVSIAATI